MSQSNTYESVQSPKHYQSTYGFEVIDVIDAYQLNFNLGNVVKYVLRAGNKPSEQRDTDLKKALWYLNREITNIMQSDLEGLAGYTNHD